MLSWHHLRVSKLHRARQKVLRSGELLLLLSSRDRTSVTMSVMTITSCPREPSSKALETYEGPTKGRSAIRVESQASSSLCKFVLHSALYNKCTQNYSSPSYSSSSSSWIRTSRIEKLPQTLSSNSGTQFFSFGLPELKKRRNVCSSSSRQRGVVVALLPGAGSVELAANLFSLATAIVVPFYTVMILAPRWEWTKKMMRSEIPYFVLGAGYIYLLALSWTPETLGLMFSSKYWLPELAGISRMFSNTVTVASAWLHLLAVDLFAGRQVFLDGAKHNIETRHSLVLCLMMCPVGVFSHLITKNLTLSIRRRDERLKTDQIPPF